MKVFQDLTIRGGRAALAQFLSDLERRLTNGWTRNRKFDSDHPRLYCFSCTAHGFRAAANLWLAPQSAEEITVSNVIPCDKSAFSYDEYNSVLREFHDQFILPAAKSAKVDVELGRPEKQIEDFLSASTAQLLRAFSHSANRWVRHHYDRERWNRFLVAAYRENSMRDGAILRRWLVEDEKWLAGPANDLASDFESGLDLLTIAESQTA